MIDDNEDLRMILVPALAAVGYTVLEAGSSNEALRLVADHRIDLLLADVVLGDHVNGFELARRIRVMQPDAKVLFITGHTFDLADAVPSAPVIWKPFRIAELTRKIADLLDGR